MFNYNNDFNQMLNKYEFSDVPKKRFVYQQPRQLLIRNLISKNTIYDSILLYYSTGVGKTLAAIGIAEGFKEYINNIGKRIVVLIKNDNIEENFRKELKSEFLGNTYNIEPEDNEDDEEQDLQNKINRRINKVYSFVTYGTFVNQTIGAKVFEKDQYNFNTKKPQRNADGDIVRKIIGGNQIKNLNNTVIIIDEAHNVTNNDVYLALEATLKNSYNYRIVLLTATPIYDNVKEIFEISNLLNMNNRDNLLPIRNDLFKDFLDKGPLVEKSVSGNLKGSIINITDHGKELLEKTLLGKISYLTVDTMSFAKKIEIGKPLTTKQGSTNIVECKMSPNQDFIYNNALQLDTKKSVVDLSDEIESLNSEENQNEITPIELMSSSLYKNSSDASTFTYPGKLFGKDGYNKCFENGKLKSDYEYIFKENLEYYSSKLYNLLQNLNKSPGSAFIYSNYVNFGGIALVKQLLLSNGYTEYNGNASNNKSKNTFVMYDDSVTAKKREVYRKIFNSDDNKYGEIIKVIIGSPMISEGISLYNIRQIHILEPSWNMSSINQIIGRGIRYRSHSGLLEEERTVEIYKYVSVGTGVSIDSQKYLLAENKDRSNKNVERLLKRISFDCSFNKKTGKEVGGSPECDYQDCDYTCKLNPSGPIDKFTYNMFIEFFEKYDIEYSTELIKDLFKKYFIWSIDDILTKIKSLTNNVITTESIFTAIHLLLTNKTFINDKYERTGFLIQKDSLLIFNPIDNDVNSSIFSKMLDFSVDFNKYNLHDYLKKYSTIQRQEQPKHTQLDKPPVQVKTQAELSELDSAFNENIMENNDIYGSFKNTKTNIVDDKLRIIDTRHIDKDTYDNRTIPTGMVLTSKKIPDIMNILEYLNINTMDFLKYHTTDINTVINILKDYENENLDGDIDNLLSRIKNNNEIDIYKIKEKLKLNKVQLINILYKYLKQHNLILK